MRRVSNTPLAKLKRQLWDLCKQITRHVHGNTCYSCGAQGLASSNWHTGHFISKSICSTELAYDLKNLRPQCGNCNIWKSGNWVGFEKHLSKDHGEEYIVELKKRNEKTKGLKYDILWYQKKIEEYQQIYEQL